MGEHKIHPKIASHLARQARDLTGLGTQPDPNAVQPDPWNPVRPEFSCAACFWNWVDDIHGTNPPQRRPICHLMPSQMMLTSNNQLAASKPGFGADPSKELCSGWKSREIPPAIDSDEPGKIASA